MTAVARERGLQMVFIGSIYRGTRALERDIKRSKNHWRFLRSYARKHPYANISKNVRELERQLCQ